MHKLIAGSVQLLKVDLSWADNVSCGLQAPYFNVPKIRSYAPHMMKAANYFSADFQMIHSPWRPQTDPSLPSNIRQIEYVLQRLAFFFPS